MVKKLEGRGGDCIFVDDVLTDSNSSPFVPGLLTRKGTEDVNYINEF